MKVEYYVLIKFKEINLYPLDNRQGLVKHVQEPERLIPELLNQDFQLRGQRLKFVWKNTISESWIRPSEPLSGFGYSWQGCT